jgi:hypothetical protein
MLQKANLYAQLDSGSDAFRLSPALSIANGMVLPLDDSGKRAWSCAGDPADSTSVPTSCSAEAMARLPERRATFHRGRMVFGSAGVA